MPEPRVQRVQVHSMSFITTPFWVQVHSLPFVITPSWVQCGCRLEFGWSAEDDKQIRKFLASALICLCLILNYIISSIISAPLFVPICLKICLFYNKSGPLPLQLPASLLWIKSRQNFISLMVYCI
jgi:hypothetical protein